MHKSKSFQLSVSFLLFASVVFAQSVAPGRRSPGKVTVSYSLDRLNRMASNQLAIWVEDDDGRYIDTLYVTRFTAEGGYTRRPDSLVEWVNVMRRSQFDQEEIDAFSAATQQPGRYEIVWDGIDFEGNPVPHGAYVVKLEGNIYWKNRILWECRFDVGLQRARAQQEVFFTTPGAESMKRLVDDVVVEFRPD